MALTVTAGGAATAAQYNALIPKYYFQGSDQALATTTLTNHNTFAAIPVADGETWVVEVHLLLTAAADNNDCKVAWAVTGGVAFAARRWSLSMATAAAGVDPVNVAMQTRARTFNTSVDGGVGTSGSNISVWHEGFVVSASGSAGTFTMQWAQQAATSGTTTMVTGSYLVAHRVL